MSKAQLVKTLRALSQESRKFSIPSGSHSGILGNASIAEKKVKSRIILTLLFAIALTSSITLMVASFLPVYVDKSYKDINLTLTGLIIRQLYHY